MSVVTFVPANFFLAYPEFASMDPARATLMFTIASQAILDNTDNSPVMDLNYRTQLFYMLIGHLLLLFGTADPTTPNNRPPGRVTNATEGTITTAFGYDIPTGSSMAPWFNQTKYGALYWMATAQFRSMQYYAAGSSGVGFAKAYGVLPFNIPGGV